MTCEIYNQFFNATCSQLKSDMYLYKRYLSYDECMGCFIDNHCAKIQSLYDYDPQFPWWQQPSLFQYLQAISGILLTVIGFFIYQNLKDVYPYNLIAISCLTEASIYMRFLRMFLCPLKIYKFLSFYYPLKKISQIDNECHYQSFETIIIIFNSHLQAFDFINLLIQVFICSELYDILRNPFYSRKRRSQFCYQILFIVFISILSIFYKVIRAKNVILYQNLSLFLFILKILLILVGCIYIILSLSILFRKGINKKLRQLAIRRQIIFIFMFLFRNIIVSIYFYDQVLLQKVFELSNDSMKFIEISSQIIGIPSAILHLSDPFVLHKIVQKLSYYKKILMNGFGNQQLIQETRVLQKQKTQKMKQNLSDAGICSFLNSAMNVEYVYIILQGIEKYIENQNSENNQQLLYKKSTSKYAFNHDVVFENVNDWDVLDKNLSGSEKSQNAAIYPAQSDIPFQKIVQLRKQCTLQVQNFPSSHELQNIERLNIEQKSSFIAHFPQKFKLLLDLDNIQFAKIQKSLSVIFNKKSVFQAGEGQGKSGQFFFYSHDKKFIIKTLKNKEKQTLIDILDQYIGHIKKSRNKSILVRIYGLFTIQSPYFSNMDIILMENISKNFEKFNNCVNTFDLKGSLFQRESEIKKGSILLDRNFLKLKQINEDIIKINPKENASLYKIIQSDAKFLEKMNLMDYSLLLNIEQIQCKVQSAFRFENLSRNEFKAYDSSVIYHVGIIDFLQTFNFNKKAEVFLKTSILRMPKNQISCSPPDYFKKRFLRFIKKEVLNKYIIQNDANLKKVLDIDDFNQYKKKIQNQQKLEIIENELKNKNQQQIECINYSLLDYTQQSISFTDQSLIQ